MTRDRFPWQYTEEQISQVLPGLNKIKEKYAKEAAEFIISLPEHLQQFALFAARDPEFELINKLALLSHEKYGYPVDGKLVKIDETY